MEDAKKSRTQKKKEDRELQKLGETLAALPSEQLKMIDIPDELDEAIQFAGETKSHGARRRQLQYIGTLMRTLDPEPIKQDLEAIRCGDARNVSTFKKIEHWRDELKLGNLELMDEILETCPEANRQRLNQLVRNARKELHGQKGVKASRALFRYLKAVGEGSQEAV
jgi:ribosome-associated protein